MALRKGDAEEVARILRLYMPTRAALQMAGDLYRSRAADRDLDFKTTIQAVRAELDAAWRGMTPQEQRK